ncbi:type II and III secretion system protein family protein [Methyloradius palustris]|uniref:Secretion protein n=1 Tax=Methyloradius palustris TaxID=2778876 RepID=A0A8D5K0J9_9PROT|nr:pilus assembly protein N-terminal domain-containing protein [Methyloradius palustris]BCM24823.1 secretion protein [Methyloradius palustris]
MNSKLKISLLLQGLVFSIALSNLTPSLAIAASTVTESGPVKTAKPITLNELPSKKFMSAHGAKPDDGNPSLDVQANVELISLYVGEATTLPVTNVSRVAVGNGKLITANVIDGREILLLGESPGDTSLFIWSGSKILKYRVKVNSQDIGDLTNNVQSMIKDLPNVKIDRVGDQIALSGTASKQDLKKLDIITQSTKQVINLVREEDVTLKKMVYIKVQFMEFRRTALQNLGIDWATSINGPSAALTADVISNNQFRYQGSSVDPSFTAGQGANAPLSISSQPWRLYLGLATTLTSRINLAISNGDAGVLASPELATRSGGEAKFLAGGQVPLPVTSPTGQVSVSFKDYGIKLNISPVVDDNNLIQAKLDTEVSAIDNSVVVQGIPGFTTRSTSSDINLKSGQTIVMSGLVNQSISNSINKFPWLGDVPILGNLFKSKNFQSNRSDLVMFVTPVVIDPASTANQQRLDKGKEMREKFDGMLGKKGIVD